MTTTKRRQAAPPTMSVVESANVEGHPFPIQNLPFGIFSTRAEPNPRIGVAIGDSILDLRALARDGTLAREGFNDEVKQGIFEQSTLNDFIGTHPARWLAFRKVLQTLLSQESSSAIKFPDASVFAERLSPDTTLHLPIKVHNYTDFYSSLEHAVNCGTLFRSKENALQKNWRHLPVAYHGRASSIVISGTQFHRPSGQTLPPGSDAPEFSDCKKLDYELELGLIVGGEATALGQRLSTQQSRQRIFGCVLLNDWSARDIQAWEYVPLGPFLSKNFCTSISPWIVTSLALEPFRRSLTNMQAPELLPYLREPATDSFVWDVELQVDLKPQMSKDYIRVSTSSTAHTYYTAAQMLTHHTVTGCPVLPGDLLGTGTLSAPGEDGYGSLLEKSLGGKRPFPVEGNIERTFLEDGDSIRFRGVGKGDGYVIGFGECEGTVLPAVPLNVDEA